MNKEILFKAKRKDNGEWVEGHYCKIDETTYCVEEDYKRFPVPTHHCILKETMTDLGLPNRFLQFEIDPNTLCQFTGLTDKNGKKIWENDIVRDKTGDIFRIYWSEQLLNYSAKCVKCLFSIFINQKWDLGTLLKSKRDVEVCGNIFDNADLLEVE